MTEEQFEKLNTKLNFICTYISGSLGYDNFLRLLDNLNDKSKETICNGLIEISK